MKLSYQILMGERLLLSNLEVHSLGPELTLQNCEIYSDCEEAALIPSGVRMSGGRFIQQDRALRDFHFEHVHFDGVKFEGAYEGVDFGDWDTPQKSSIVSCDFTLARLDGCRFLNCDIHTILLPKWPCYTIVDLPTARSFVLARQWPTKIALYLDVDTDNDPECVAISGDAARLARKAGITLDELRGLLQPIPGMLIID